MIHPDTGQPVRRGAEKSLKLTQQMLMYTCKRGDVVVDIDAGTASMGAGCMLRGQTYFGVEIDQSIARLGQNKYGMHDLSGLECLGISSTGDCRMFAAGLFNCQMTGLPD
jgi:DNA modification methylase